MRRRTKVLEQKTFLAHVCNALDLSPRDLAYVLQRPIADIQSVVSAQTTTKLTDLELDELWYDVAELVQERLGGLMAIRLELNKLLQKDRVRRAAQHARARSFAGRSSPRS